MKHRIGDLAIFGGTPDFKDPLHVGRPFIGSRSEFLNRVENALDRRWLTNDGPILQEFEATLASLVGAKHVVPVANGTLGLMLVAKALGLEGEIIMPSFTYVATAHAMQWQGVTPVFCDVDPHTHNLDPARVEALITPRTSAILGVHLWGRPCNIEALQRIADRHGLALLFDAAHAFNVAVDGRKIGSFGRAEVFSFHATKFINSLEGGAVATNDDGLAEQIRLLANFGFTGQDSIAQIGINAKMHEISAAMGLATLAHIDTITSINQDNHRSYARELSGIRGVRLLDFEDVESANNQYVVAEVCAEAFGLHRDQLVAALQAENVLARRYFTPGCHRVPPYEGSAGPLPVTERLCEEVISFPCGSEINRGDIIRIVDLVGFLSRHADAIVQQTGGARALSAGARD